VSDTRRRRGRAVPTFDGGGGSSTVSPSPSSHPLFSVVPSSSTSAPFGRSSCALRLSPNFATEAPLISESSANYSLVNMDLRLDSPRLRRLGSFPGGFRPWLTAFSKRIHTRGPALPVGFTSRWPTWPRTRVYGTVFLASTARTIYASPRISSRPSSGCCHTQGVLQQAFHTHIRTLSPPPAALFFFLHIRYLLQI